MRSRGSQNRLSGDSFGSRVSALMLAMIATMATVYVAGRLWQDAESRAYFIEELEKRTGQGQSAVSVDDTLKVTACREQQKKLSVLEMELAAARQEGFVPKRLPGNHGKHPTKKELLVVGVMTTFGRKKNQEAIRKAWMPTETLSELIDTLFVGTPMRKLVDKKGIIVRFVIGRSANRGDSLDKEIETESSLTNDFIILDNQVEAPEEKANKIKSFFIYAVSNWDAEFYAKVNDDVYVNLDALGGVLTSHLDKPRVYIGCMKSGQVFSEPTHKWHEPDWWKFGDGKSYFRHASGEVYVISKALVQFISINRFILRTYAHDDVSIGSWFIGLDVEHLDETKFCCSSRWSPGAICAAVIFRYDNFNQQLILPLECRELLVRSYASLTIDTYMLLRMFKDKSHTETTPFLELKMKTTSGGGGGVGAAESDNRTATVGIEFTKDKNGISLLILRNHRGASATVSLHGGQVLSWKTELGEELLFISNKSSQSSAWRNSNLFSTVWESGYSRATWICEEQNLDYRAKSSTASGGFQWKISPKGLFGNRWQSNLTSRIRNVNGKNFSFSMPSIRDNLLLTLDSEVRVEALETLDYLDNLYQRERFTEQGDSLTFESEVDRVYFDSSNIVIVLDHEKKRTFVIRKEGLPDVVVWNPWERKSKSILDLGDEEYKQMLCVDGAVEKPNHLVAR
ncbi:Hydroxyproline O-galactosyltransferase HPGT1 [Glycine soja]